MLKKLFVGICAGVGVIYIGAFLYGIINDIIELRANRKNENCKVTDEIDIDDLLRGEQQLNTPQS